MELASKSSRSSETRRRSKLGPPVVKRREPLARLKKLFPTARVSSDDTQVNREYGGNAPAEKCRPHV
ncbi:hypothetical protein IF2G_02544 [Cordyceps javanica]|nr:hypothetical protein IF2G_02544 [Cordyceps javanica]